MSNYTPYDWYWLADDGRLYGSARQKLVTNHETDEAYGAWLEGDRRPTRWPADDQGNQTEAALAAVLAPYGLTVSAPSLKTRLAAYAADKRWMIETGGITVNGARIDTSRVSQAMITGAYSYSQAHPEELIRFKADSGWATLDSATLKAIASAVGAHVQACFAKEAAIDEAIEAGTITAPEQIDAIDWPS